MARPTTYNEETAAKLCGYLSIGESLRKACRHPGMPAPSTVFLWLAEHDEFSEQYARAKEEAADMFIEDILEIADDAKKDKFPVYHLNDEGEKVLIGYNESKNSVQRARVRIDSRKWLAMKLKPKKYGDKVTIDGKQEHSGKVDHQHNYSTLSDEELIARAKLIISKSTVDGEEVDDDE